MSEKNMIDVLREEIKIPDVVQNRADEAFARIREESSQERKWEGSRGRGAAVYTFRKSRKKMGIALLASALTLGTLTVGAAAYLKWSSGLEKGLQVTDEQKEAAENSGLADFPGISVTDAGVTVTAQQSIVDNYYAYLSFKVEGYEIPKGVQPGFKMVDVKADGEAVTSGSGFYDGLIEGEDGRAMLADGSEILKDENGNLLIDYTQEDGSLEYRINLSSDGKKGFLLGKSIHVEFSGLGYYPAGGAEAVETEVDGTWAFDWTLQGDDNIYTAECSEPLGDTGAVIIGAEISPISIKAVYDFPRQEITKSDPPVLMGVKLKDGTLLPRLYMGPGQQGYVDDESSQYETMFAIDRILDVEQVQSLLFLKESPEGEGGVLTEENLYVVDIR